MHLHLVGERVGYGCLSPIPPPWSTPMKRPSALAILCLVSGAAVALEIPPMIRAGGTVYLKVRPGPLRLIVRKRDLNIYPNEDALAVRVIDPLHRPLAVATMPDDGAAPRTGAAKTVQEHVFSLDLEMGGVVQVAIGTNGDMVWGIEADAQGLVVGSNIMLNDPDFGARIYFPPPPGEFRVEAQAIHPPGFQDLPLVDAGGKAVHTFPLAKSNEFLPFAVPADAGDRSGLWHFAVAKADVRMRFRKPEPRWTVNPDWWFELPPPSWTLLPRHSVRYVSPGQTTTFRLRQYGAREGEETAPEFRFASAKGPRFARARVAKVTSAPVPGTSAARVVEVEASVPADARPGESFSVCLYADHPVGIVGSAELELRVGESPVPRPLELPIRHGLHAHENVLFGYAPDYPTNEVYFSPDNRALIRNRWLDRNWTSAVVLREGDRWVERPFTEALNEAYPEGWGINRGAGFVNCKVVADRSGGLYTALCTRHADKVGRISLLYSFDDGRTWRVVGVPGSAYDLENFSGHNALAGPTPLLVYRFRAKHPTAKWGAYHDLLLYLPRRVGNRLELGEPVQLADDCLGSCQHSGGPPSLATRDGRTHVIWGQAIETEAPGVPTFVATVEHATRRISPPVFLGHAPPINDVHNVPAVCLDSQGTVHIVTGAHGDNFTYRHSLRPNDTQSGFSPAVNTLDAGYVDKDTDADGRGRQTYCSLVCDDRDTLHIAFRQWRCGVDPDHGGANYAALSVQSKPKGGPWGPARPLVVPPVPGYSIYYHKLTIAPDSSLWLSYSHFTADESYQSQFPELYNHRAVLVSKDRGATWKLAEGRDFPGGE